MNSLIFDFLYSLANQNALIDWLIRFFADYLPWVLVIALLWQLLRAVEGRCSFRPFGLMLLGTLLGSVLANLIKLFYYQARPFAERTDVKALFPYVADGSFPSAHATAFMALAVIVWRFRPKWGPWYFAGAILIGLARVMAGLHWPLDILVGWLLGAIIATCVIRVFGYNRRDVAA